MKTLIYLVTLSFFSGLAHANSSELFIKAPIQGTLTVDLEQNRGAITLEGEAAKKLYDLLSVEPMELSDPDDGTSLGNRKISQNYTCSKSPSDKYDCVIAITDTAAGSIQSFKLKP